MEFLNLEREPKLTILGGKLFQTFTTRSLKKVFPLVCAAVINRLPLVYDSRRFRHELMNYCDDLCGTRVNRKSRD